MLVQIDVPGIPQTQGSIAFKGMSKAGKPILTSDNANLKPWRMSVKVAAQVKWMNRAPLTGPVELYIRFYLPRPKRHFAKDGKVRPQNVGINHQTRPDLDKLTRAIGDALKTAGVYNDDSQVHVCDSSKMYALENGFLGARIVIGTGNDGEIN